MADDTRPNQYRDYLPNQREEFGPRFSFEEYPQHYCIMYRGVVLCIINKEATDLPDGLQRRLATHVMDLVVGRRTALWDEQAIYGRYPRDPDHARINGERVADHAAMERERGLEGSEE